MDAGRRQPEHRVSGLESASRQQCSALGRADRKAREVEVAVGVEARHLRGLAPDQRAAGLGATRGDPPDDRFGDALVELAGGEIVEEQQRLRALDDDVVDAHRDEVDPDRVADPALDRDFHLGADAVVGGDQDRIDEPGRLEVEQAAEAAQFRVRPRPAGRARQRLDPVHQPVAGVDIDPGVGIGERFRTFGHCGSSTMGSGRWA